jgi:hypothetical protein
LFICKDLQLAGLDALRRQVLAGKLALVSIALYQAYNQSSLSFFTEKNTKLDEIYRKPQATLQKARLAESLIDSASPAQNEN